MRKMGYERYLGWPTAACMVRDFVERPEHATKLKTALVTMVSDAENHLNIERESMDTEGEEKDSHAVDWVRKHTYLHMRHGFCISHTSNFFVYYIRTIRHKENSI